MQNLGSNRSSREPSNGSVEDGSSGEDLSGVPSKHSRSRVAKSKSLQGSELNVISHFLKDRDAAACSNTTERAREPRDKVSKRSFFCKAEAQSKHSREAFSSSEEGDRQEDIPEDRQSEPMSDEPEVLLCRSHPSQRSTDCSKSFSQIYSEIYEESKEREKKAERACRTYHINKSKLHRNHERSDSGSAVYEREEGSLGSEYSSYSARRSRDYESESMQELDFESFVRDQQRSIVGYQDHESFRSERSSFKRLIASEWEESIHEDNAMEIDVRSRVTSFRKVSRHSKRSIKEIQGSENAKQGRVSKRSSTRKSDHKYIEKYPQRSSSRQKLHSERGKSSCYTRSKKASSESFHPEESKGIESEDYKSQRSATSTSLQSGGEKDYLSSGSARHHRHHHYRRQHGEPKTYQDRGNSPINIKTSRHSSEVQEPQKDFDSEDSHESSMGRLSNSVGVQCPSDDEEAPPYTEGIESHFSGQQENLDGMESNFFEQQEKLEGMESNNSEQHENLEEKSTWCRKEKQDSIIAEVVTRMFNEELTLRKYNLLDILAQHEVGPVPNKTEDYSHAGEEELKDDYDENMSAYEGASQNQANSLYSEGASHNPIYSAYSEGASQNPTYSEYSESASQNPPYSEYSEEAVQNPTNLVDSECDQMITTEESVKSELPQSVEQPEPTNAFNLRIYDADEALMVMPENYEGNAIIIDEDADFLDISLTDDEEKIKAKLMAAALTTKRTSSSSSPTSSSPKTSAISSPKSSQPSIYSYRPSVIFSRRSEVEEDDLPLRSDNRIALLAEQTLRHCSRNYTNWLPLEVRAVPNTLSLEEWDDTTMRLSADRQSLSEEFHKKLHRQLKVVVESFQ